MKRSVFLYILLAVSSLIFAQRVEIVSGPYLQALGEEGVTIVWTTNVDALSWVELADGNIESFYGKKQAKYYETSHGKRSIGKLHRIKITGLTSGKTYKYRAFSQAVLSNDPSNILYGSIASTNVYRRQPLRFKTLDPTKDNFTAYVVNDIHGLNDNLKAMLKDVSFETTDLVIFNGDMVDHLQDESSIFTDFMDTSIELFASEVPVFYARGNHETRGAFSTQFPDYFPTNNDKLYYTFKQGPAFFIVLDSGEDKPDSDIEYFGLSDFDKYRTKQQEWLKEVVKSDEFKSAPFKVVILHIPPRGSWHGGLDLRDKFLPVLNDNSIDVMLSGHTHNFEYITPESYSFTDFPIFINDNETYLFINATENKMVIQQKDMTGRVLNEFHYEN
jgi:predicted MPP superfamily phosphohydrolase